MYFTQKKKVILSAILLSAFPQVSGAYIDESIEIALKNSIETAQIEEAIRQSKESAEIEQAIRDIEELKMIEEAIELSLQEMKSKKKIFTIENIVPESVTHDAEQNIKNAPQTIAHNTSTVYTPAFHKDFAEAINITKPTNKVDALIAEIEKDLPSPKNHMPVENLEDVIADIEKDLIASNKTNNQLREGTIKILTLENATPLKRKILAETEREIKTVKILKETERSTPEKIIKTNNQLREGTVKILTLENATPLKRKILAETEREIKTVKILKEIERSTPEKIIEKKSNTPKVSLNFLDQIKNGVSLKKLEDSKKNEYKNVLNNPKQTLFNELKVIINEDRTGTQSEDSTIDSEKNFDEIQKTNNERNQLLRNIEKIKQWYGNPSILSLEEKLSFAQQAVKIFFEKEEKNGKIDKLNNFLQNSGFKKSFDQIKVGEKFSSDQDMTKWIEDFSQKWNNENLSTLQKNQLKFGEKPKASKTSHFSEIYNAVLIEGTKKAQDDFISNNKEKFKNIIDHIIIENGNIKFSLENIKGNGEEILHLMNEWSTLQKSTAQENLNQISVNAVNQTEKYKGKTFAEAIRGNRPQYDEDFDSDNDDDDSDFD